MTRARQRRGTAADVLGPLLHEALGVELPFGVRFWDGSTLGPANAAQTLVVRHRRALRRLLWAPDEIGLARAYVSGDLDVEGDLFALMDQLLAFIRPDDVVGIRPGARTLASLAGAALRLGIVGLPPKPPAEEVRLRGGRHTLGRDAEAIAHHYDVGNDFYRHVLGESMTYSCAYWAHLDDEHLDDEHLDDEHLHDDTAGAGPDGRDGLTRAQFAKCDLVARKLGLTPGMRVLDVGCGWGTFALHAARTYGVHVVGITLSQAQAEYARARMVAEGVDHLVEIRVQDYREIQDGPFDAVASIGMAEHVGAANLATYAADLFALVRPEGRVLNHAISLRPDDPQQGPESSSFIDRYVFPDGELVPVATMVGALEGAGLEVRDVESLREHYALTLRAWAANLDRCWDAAVAVSTPGRARVWRLYMTACALGFEDNEIGVNQVLAVRPGPRGGSGMPLTRARMLGRRTSDRTAAGVDLTP